MPPMSHPTDLTQGPLHKARSGLATLPTRLLRWCAIRCESWRQRRQLMELDEHLLRDIGLSRRDARCDWITGPKPKP